MSSTVRKSKNAELEIYVWLIEQCDYDDGRDDDGRTRVIDVFAHLEAANKAAEAVFDSQCPDEEPGSDEEDNEVEESDIKQHLGTNGCYERTYDADQSQGQSRDAYGNFDGYGGFTVSHCEFDDEEDYEGHTTVLEVHADLASANQAAREHFDWAYEDTHEREEDEDEDEEEDYDDVKHHLKPIG
ncbi:hypothetical protein LTS10_000215 [Elasticomyces elasticus]|nr:hypothetical protein LTS10_000215 [Elasticomyces elasticus]